MASRCVLLEKKFQIFLKTCLHPREMPRIRIDAQNLRPSKQGQVQYFGHLFPQNSSQSHDFGDPP